MKQRVTKLEIIIALFFLQGIFIQLQAQSAGAVNKTATPSVDTNGNSINNTWDVTLEIDAGATYKEYNVPTDVVLVIDKSTSMNTNDRFKNTKLAAIALVDKLLTNHPDVRIGVVSFGNTASVETGLTNDLNTLTNEINTIPLGGYTTFVQDGIHQARLMLDASTRTNQHIVVLADGAARTQFSFNHPLVTNEFISSGSDALVTKLADIVHNSFSPNSYRIDIGGVNNATNAVFMGNFYGSSYANLQRYDFLESEYDYNNKIGSDGELIEEMTLENTTIDYYYYVPGLAAINEAQFAKNDGITVHSIALDLRTTIPVEVFGTEIMKNIATSGDLFYAATQTDIVDTFKTIADYIYPEIIYGEVEDLIGDGFVLQNILSSSPITTSGNILTAVNTTGDNNTSGTKSVVYDITEDKITWTFDMNAANQKITLTYRLFLDMTGSHGTPVQNLTSTQGPNLGGYDTNKSAILTYNGGKIKIFPRPTVATSICEIAPNLQSTNIKSTNTGISTLNRNADLWLPINNQMGAYIVLESKDKGFVVPRFENTSDIINNIGVDTTAGVEEGMIVWDNEKNCLKLFFDKNSNGTMTWNCISSNSCNNLIP